MSALGTLLAPPEEAQHEAMRDWRMNAALRYSAGAAVAMSALVGFVAWQLARRGAVWPLLYIALGALGIIVVVVTTFAWVLGRTGLKLSITKDGLEAQDAPAGSQP